MRGQIEHKTFDALKSSSFSQIFHDILVCILFFKRYFSGSPGGHGRTVFKLYRKQNTQIAKVFILNVSFDLLPYYTVEIHFILNLKLHFKKVIL